MTIRLKTYNEILGDLIRKIIVDTPINDLNEGSVSTVLLEAIADSDFETSTAILSLLNFSNLDALNGIDLDNKGQEFGVFRYQNQSAVGKIDITDGSITKQSTSLYSLKLPPIAGSNVLYVTNVAGWSNTGTLFIGRGTNNFEGPIVYSGIVNNGTFYTITLSSALNNDHLLSEAVTNAQGTTDRYISAGTIVQIDANDENPAILYSTVRQAIIYSGETEITGIDIVAQDAGSIGNVSKNTITSFKTIPFIGAMVTNPSSTSQGLDREDDTSYRNRIKNFSVSLSNGTKKAIVDAVIGISDSAEGKQVTSAYLTEPLNLTDSSLLYINDSTGLQPSFTGQAYDILIQKAIGDEKFIQLTNFPLPRPQLISTNEGPYILNDGDILSVSVDGLSEEIVFNSIDFINIAFASLPEVVTVINDNSTLINCRLTDNSNYLLIYPKDLNAEKIQVIAPITTVEMTIDANREFMFSTVEKYGLKLYRNNELLNQKEEAAFVETTQFSSWKIFTDGSILISVDGTTQQTINFFSSDFTTSNFSTATLSDWVDVFNTKVAGITASASTDGRLVITSNNSGNKSSIEIIGGGSGGYFAKMFTDMPTYSVGQTSDYILNRQNGAIELNITLNAGDLIIAGAEDTKGACYSAITPTGTYDLSTDTDSRNSILVILEDSKGYEPKPLALSVSDTIIVDAVSTYPLIRLTSSSLETFATILPNDYIYICYYTDTSSFSLANTGLFRVIDKGNHTSLSDAYIEFYNVNAVTEAGPIAIQSLTDIFAFSSDVYPQLWDATSMSGVLTIESLTDIVTSINSQTVNILGSVYQGNRIKITSTTENSGSIALAVVTGRAKQYWSIGSAADYGNYSHKAVKANDINVSSFFRRSTPSTAYFNTTWDRYTYNELHDTLSVSTPSDNTGTVGYQDRFTSNVFPYVTYNDYINFIERDNDEVFKTIQAFPTTDKADTQYTQLKTLFSNIANVDDFNIFKMSELSDNDSLVITMDGDNIYKNVDINFYRAGIINAGSGSTLVPPLPGYLPQINSFSANDVDNEPGIDFSNPQVWGKTVTGAEFKDYAIWFRSRNYYSSGGIAATLGKLFVRAAEFGPYGDQLKFQIEYPKDASLAATYSYIVNPGNTLFTYYFGSSAQKSTGIHLGTNIAVTALGGYDFRYTFSNPVNPQPDFSTVVVGDILNVMNTSGVSTVNSGIFRVKATGATTLDLTNLTGSLTGAGTEEETTVTTLSDVPGTPGQFNFDCSTIINGAAVDGTYFVVEENLGTTKYWYNVSGITPEPVYAATRSIEIATVLAADSPAYVAQKTAYAIALNSAISTTITGGTLINCVNIENNNRTLYSAGTTTYNLVTIDAGTNPASLDGTFFIIGSSTGLIKVWFSTKSSTTEPAYGTPTVLSVHVSLTAGDVDTVVATAIANKLNILVSEYTAIAAAAVVTVQAATVGGRTLAYDMTTGFTIARIVTGTAATPEVVTADNTVKIYPIDATTTDTGYIATNVNNSGVILAVDIPSLTNTIVVATRDEAVSVAYDHDPTMGSGKNYFVSLFDGQNWIKSFSNTNPNFTLKNTLVSYSYPYTLDATPNWGTTDTGEYFRLIPRSIDNVYHHLTHKALSQLSIIADVDISNNRKKIQIKSKLVGSEGSVTVLGGSASTSELSVINSAVVENYLGTDYLKATTNAFPFIYNVGDSVELTALRGTKRKNFLIPTDKVSVIRVPDINNVRRYDYRFEAKADFSLISPTKFCIQPADDVYFGATPPVTGIVWRLFFDTDPLGLTNVKVGDVLIAHARNISFPCFSGWDATNTYGRTFGDDYFPGFPIVGKHSSMGTTSYIDIINPYGVIMGDQTSPNPTPGILLTPATDYLAVHPAPSIEFKLKHSSYINISSLSYNFPHTVVTVETDVDHSFNVGDTVYIISNITTGAFYTAPVLSVLTSKKFTFDPSLTLPLSIPIATSGGGSGGRVAKVTVSGWTKYKLQKLGFKNLVKLSWVEGDQPWFSYCGVAVDDYIKISGQTFSSENTGIFKVRGVYSTAGEDYVVFENENAADNLNTITSINYRDIAVNWVNNANVVTSTIAGVFENVSPGDWIKKVSDDDIYYQQVMTPAASAFDTGNAYDATQVFLGAAYRGTSAAALGVNYNQINGVNDGVYLMDPSDILFYEGDSCLTEDILSITSISDVNWFNPNNTGTREIIATGVMEDNGVTTYSYKPFVRVYNNLGIATSSTPVLLSAGSDSVNIYEGAGNIYSSIREINNIAIDPNNINQRIVYLTPSCRSYKVTESNGIFLNGIGKLDYDSNISVGVDGYEYYTGLLQKVQWTVDGYNLDPTSYPGIKSVGTKIETIPSLIKNVDLSLNATFTDGVNITDVVNNTRVVISNYVNSLDVGEDVILSEIIYNVMKVRGIEAVTFTYPAPTNERIIINDYEKAYVNIDDINIV